MTEIGEFLGLFGGDEEPVLVDTTPCTALPVACEADTEVTLAEAKERLFAQAQDGVGCPCCGQFVRIYARKLNRNMMLFLVSLARKPGQWVCFRDCEFTSRDYPYLSFWGLAITRVDAGDGTKKSSGFWKITQKGLDFLAGRLSVPSHVHIYNNAIVGWSDTPTTASRAYGDGFDYSELMESTDL